MLPLKETCRIWPRYVRCEEMGYRVASASTMLAAKWGSNITEWGLGQFRKHYGDNGISNSSESRGNEQLTAGGERI